MRKRKRKETLEQFARDVLREALGEPSNHTYEMMLEAFYVELRKLYYDFHQEASNARVSSTSQGSGDISL